MKIMARLFAQQFIKPLYHEIYSLVVENEQAEKIVEIAGNFVRNRPKKLDGKARCNCRDAFRRVRARERSAKAPIYAHIDVARPNACASL